ncbi:MAG: ABC transporter permease [Planctomycetes bacterium]|jgi:putative ABC transport system permease protein|nr:ABC transporter permease [Planctomycetota bacterium]
MIWRGAKMVRNIRSGLENLLLHKLRSFLTMLGVVFGVGSVVAMLSVGEGAGREALEQIHKLGSNNILVSSVKPTEDQSASVNRSLVSMSVYGLTYEDHLRMAECLEHVRRTAPVKVMRQQGRLGERTLEVRVVGTTPEWFELVDREVLAGRTLLSANPANPAPAAVLTEFGARKLLATKHSIGEWVRIGGNYFEIVGIIRSEGGKAGDIQLPDEEVDVYIPLPVARQYFGDVNTRSISAGRSLERIELHQAIVQVDGIEYVEATAKAIERMLSHYHKKKDYAVSVPLTLLRQAEAAKRRSSIVLGSIAAISLLVGGIGIMNIMLASVTERTREIGIRRAIGAKRRQIVSQFLVETVVLSTTGGLVGLGIGVLIPALITHFSGMTTILTWKGILLPLLISMTIGILFGLYPALHAARVDPIVALRHE